MNSKKQCLTQDDWKIIKSQYEKNKIGWKKSFLENFSQNENGDNLPWMTYPFIDFITTQLNSDQQIFEFGSGSSTLFFAKRVKKIIAVESNKKWFEAMKIKIAALGIKNIELVLIENAITNSQYENYTKQFSTKFDFIIIDSLKRFECAKNSFTSLKDNGRLILDDSERKNYQKIFSFLLEKEFSFLNFAGIAPAQFRLKNTTIFQKKSCEIFS